MNIQNLPLPAQQLFWAMGALERLQELGVIGNTPYHIVPSEIDLWQEVDERRMEILADDRILRSLVIHLCRDGGMTDDGDMRRIAFLVREFRDHREKMVQFMLEKVAGQ